MGDIELPPLKDEALGGFSQGSPDSIQYFRYQILRIRHNVVVWKKNMENEEKIFFFKVPVIGLRSKMYARISAQIYLDLSTFEKFAEIVNSYRLNKI